ncbi:MAG: hypothetical protein ACRD2X_22380 [Vicinamibacteraceae bacterium]
MTVLRQRMIEDMQVRNFSAHTAYVFDIEQTDGAPLPQPSPIEGFRSRLLTGYWPVCTRSTPGSRLA